MRVASDWKDYRIIATGDGYKLERWGDTVLLRPDPQVIWPAPFDLRGYKGLNAVYERDSGGGGRWTELTRMPASWVANYKDYKFYIKPMGFKHTGLFPEQSVNWDIMSGLIAGAGRPIKVLNLFAYTGGASIACAKAGAAVTHIDAAKGMVERAGENARLNKLDNIRFIVEDCGKFVSREIRRGNRYDAILMDPPSYGRGPGGEMWKIENDIFELVKMCTEVLSDKPCFFLLNSYTTGLQPSVMSNVLALTVGKKYKGNIDAYELAFPTDEGIVLPCGASAMFRGSY